MGRDRMNGLHCPKCGKQHQETERWNQKLERFESVVVCQECGYTAYIELYRHADFMEP